MIEITKKVWAPGMQPVWYDVDLLKEMTRRKIPVNGAISVNGVHGGALLITRSGDQMVYRYYEPGEAINTVAPAKPADEDDGEL